jgi:hypothetical protein
MKSSCIFLISNLHLFVIISKQQILVHPDDREFQKIIWRFSFDEPIQTFRLKTVTYGTTSAPFLAVSTLQQLAVDEKDQFPLAHAIVLNEFYID